MRKLIAVTLIAMFSATAAYAASAGCEARAHDKHGKPLKGAAKTAFLKKCEKQAASACAGKAVDKHGKPLRGAAKNAFLKKCEKNAAK